MNIFNKIKWVLGVLMIFVVVITTNLIDKDNFTRVKDSVVNIYQDRLIAKDLIFKIANKINEKEIAVLKNDSIYFKHKNYNTNKEIDNLIYQFEQTNLTPYEFDVFNSLKTEINSLKALEKKIETKSIELEDKILENISDIKYSLIDLSVIQVNEGNKQMYISKKAISTIELFTQMEIYFLVFLAIIIQIIIIYKPKEE